MNLMENELIENMPKEAETSEKYTQLYDMLEAMSMGIGIIFGCTDNHEILSEVEIEKVCRRAFILAVLEYKPEKEKQFTAHLEQIVYRELKIALLLKTKGMLNDNVEIRRFELIGTPEEDLYKEFMQKGTTPSMKDRAMKMLLEKRAQNTAEIHISSDHFPPQLVRYVLSSAFMKDTD